MSRPRPVGHLLRVSVVTLLAGGALLARLSTEGGTSAGVDSALARAVATPGDAGRENDLGNHLLLAGELDAAEAAYRRAIAAAPADAPGSATPHYNLGCLLLERGRRFSARRELLRALELDPRHAEARLALGMVHDELGLDWLARRDYRQAFELSPALADPKLHPETARHRQALAAQLELWSREPESPAPPLPGAAAMAPKVMKRGAEASPESASDASTNEESPADAGGAAGGGYARVTGGERTSRAAGAEPHEEGTSGEVPRSSRGTPRAAGDAVIDPSDLHPGAFVNQAVAPGESERGGRSGRGQPTRPTKPSRGMGSRFTPPARPLDPEEVPEFDPDEESTGRLEPIFLPVDVERFAIAG